MDFPETWTDFYIPTEIIYSAFRLSVARSTAASDGNRW